MERPIPAPLAGIEEMVAAMEHVVAERQRKRHCAVSWEFFSEEGYHCAEAPCLCCAKEVTPMATRWWHGISRWHMAQRKRAREIAALSGSEAKERFYEYLEDVHENDLRGAIHDAWEAKRPDTESGWNQERTRYEVKWQ